ncbi:sensor histidine kinase [Solihabitans fulvus]|uniref:Sensor histidine kinase n=1 Tax=Solihabitans fulvus TaxID=1892852 RepID=A0A5B2W904_9PSEU|nr:ATP-binding protein [Solihabitans fulvus]KAA2247308.1 sensor histidine kinase [Solihabitans fulvus]
MIFQVGESDKDFNYRTTYKLLRPFEAVALLLQAANLVGALFNDNYGPNGVRILVALTVAHFLGAVWTVRHRGPVTSGAYWAGVWVAITFVVQLAIAHLIHPGDFGGYGNGIQAGNFSLITLTILAFYPWRGRFQRRSIEVALLCAVAFQPILIIGIMNSWSFSTEQARSLVQYAVWAIVWFLVGKGMAKLCRIAVQAELKATVSAYDVTLGEIHSSVETAIDRIANGESSKRAAIDLRKIVYRHRRQLLLAYRQVGAVEIFKNTYWLFGGQLTLLSTPRLGGLTFSNERAKLIEECLVNSLKNVVRHGGGRVHVALELHHGNVVVLTIRDEGPGMAQDDFDMVGSTMQRIKVRAKEMGGDFRLITPSITGAEVRLSLPLH